jgi:hypothetical protein
VRQKGPEPVHIQPGRIGPRKKQLERDARRTAAADGDASGEVDLAVADFVPSGRLKLFFGCYGDMPEILRTPDIFGPEAAIPQELSIKGGA